MDRAEIGGWLSGPPTTPLAPGEHRGSRFGLPESGPGSIAGFGRRIPALFVDWLVALFVGRVIAPGVDYPSDGSALVTLGTFAFMVALLTWLGGASFGHRLFGLRVVRIDGQAPGLWRAALRTLLICLVIPVAFWDQDGRGLHDKLAGTVLLRLR